MWKCEKKKKIQEKKVFKKMFLQKILHVRVS